MRCWRASRSCPQTCAAARPPQGVLAKVAKPIQEERVDLPTIGLATIEGPIAPELAGVVGLAGKMLVIDRAAVAAAADAAGLFVAGVADPSR